MSRAQGFEPLEMKIDRTIANHAAAGQRNCRLLGAPKQWTENADRRAHFAHDFVGRDRADAFRLDGDGSTRPFYLGAKVSEDLKHVMDVTQIGHMMDHT